MSDTFLSKLKQALKNCIAEVNSIRDIFCYHPGIDFTRERKISFTDICNSLIQLQGKSMPCEILDLWGHDAAAPTPSAFIQQRKKNHAGGVCLFVFSFFFCNSSSSR